MDGLALRRRSFHEEWLSSYRLRVGGLETGANRLHRLHWCEHLPFLLKMAEREGFEPSRRYKRLHDFQSCSFNHSDISPIKSQCSRGSTRGDPATRPLVTSTLTNSDGRSGLASLICVLRHFMALTPTCAD